LLTLEKDAVIVTGVDVLTLLVVTEKVCEVAPDGTTTEAGTPAAALELESATATPPLPAAAVNVTVPVPGWPLVMVPGLTETLLSAAGAGLIVRPKVAFTPE
jgi:hypothetical protein